jgi:hypothetical protein
LNKKGRIVSINGVSITITDMDYGELKASNVGTLNVFNISFNVTVNDNCFLINFSNGAPDNQNQAVSATFIGIGDSYIQFLKEVESSPGYQHGKDTESAANKVIGAIAQSVYNDVQSHSPDQDEE